MKKSEERVKLCSIIINNYEESIKIANRTLPKPYFKGKSRIPKKYQGEDFGFDKRNRLINVKTGEVLVSNSRSAGKPRYFKVNGQDLYNGRINPMMRFSLVQKIHDYIDPYLSEVELPEDINNYPLILELLFYVHDKGRHSIDNDNKWLWVKIVRDSLTNQGKWPDDNNQYVNRDEYETIFIPDDEEQKLIINIYGRGEG